MSRPRVYTDYLADILDAAEKAERFVAGRALAAFKADDMAVFAVIRALEVVGEGTRQIPNAVRDRHPDIQWRDMAGMRDKPTHQYFGVDLEHVFRRASNVSLRTRSGRRRHSRSCRGRLCALPAHTTFRPFLRRLSPTEPASRVSHAHEASLG